MKGDDDGAFTRLRLVVGYVVVVVWAVMFVTALFVPPRDGTLYISVQAVMLVVAGSLFAESLYRRKP